MGVENVSSGTNNSITKKDFKHKLETKGANPQTIDKAVTIFENHDTNNKGDNKNVLDVNEQMAAKNDFAALGIEITAEGDVNVKTPEEMQKEQENKPTTPETPAAQTPETQKGDKPETTATDKKDKTPATPEPAQFANDDAAKIGVYRYLLNDTDNKIDNSVLENITSHRESAVQVDRKESGVDVQQATDAKGNKISFVQYGGKFYKIIKNTDGKIDIVEDSDKNYKKGDDGKYTYDAAGGTVDNPQSLREALIKGDSTDNKHNYMNRHGIKGNSKSNYNGKVINNTSSNRQHVNPVQTFTSMLLNNNEDATLNFTQQLKGEDVINVVLADNKNRSEHADEISMQDLVKYLNASIDEAYETINAKKVYGSRTAAKDVDMDLKDMANIGVIFQKYDTNGNGYLNKDELNKLIHDLTSGKSTTKIARESYNDTNPTKPQNDGDKPPVKPHNDTPQQGEEMKANRTRHIAGTKKGEANHDISYNYNNGLRTIVENGHAVENENIAEYKDHGLFGAGKKDFIRIKGLPSKVRAEVVHGKLGDSEIRIKVKDSKGEVKYYNVTYDRGNKTYNLGNEVNKKGKAIAEKPKEPEPTDDKKTKKS